MKQYKKRIDDYKKLIQEQYVREASVQSLIVQCKDVIPNWEECTISYFEFLYEQSKFIKKRWWVIQAGVLMMLWRILKEYGGAERMERMIGMSAALFAILIIPEIWKNHRCSAMEIEGACFYSLRQVCAAKILLFAIADLIMITIFFTVTFHTVQISVYEMTINFLVPFNISSCICFRLLCSRKQEMDYIAVLAIGIWTVVWMMIASQDLLYSMVAEPVWIGLLLLSFIYLVFCVYKSQCYYERIWEEKIDGINA